MKKLHITIKGPAPAPADTEFVSQLVGQVAHDAESDDDGVVYAMDLSGASLRYNWAAKIEDAIPNDLALLREARDFAQFSDLPKTVKEALFRVIDENNGLWPCEPRTAS
jgi:hypothetical protein